MAKDKKLPDRSPFEYFQELRKSAGNPIVYKAIVEQILEKYGSDKGFIKAVSEESGISEGKITDEIIEVANSPVEYSQKQEQEKAVTTDAPIDAGSPAQPPQPTPEQANAAPSMPQGQAPGMAQGQPQQPLAQSPAPQTPPTAQPQSAAPPQGLMAGAAANQAKGMSPGQALNVANQQPKPAMKDGGEVKGKETTPQRSNLTSVMESGLFNRPSKAKMEAGGDFNTTDIEGAHAPGMLFGGVVSLPDFNKSVTMAKGGLKDQNKRTGFDTTPKVNDDMVKNPGIFSRMPNAAERPQKEPPIPMEDPRWKSLDEYLEYVDKYNQDNQLELEQGGTEIPPGALPEEVADDQPVMLSKGEFVLPANVVRWHGLKNIMKLRDSALIGLEKMEEAGQVRRPGDGKNPGEPGEVEAKPVLAEEDPDELYIKSGGSLADVKQGSTLDLKTRHLRHNPTYQHASGLNAPQYGGGPNMNRGGSVSGKPTDNAVNAGINMLPMASPGGQKAPSVTNNKAKLKAKGKSNGLFRPAKMAAGGDLDGDGDVDEDDLKREGAYLNNLLIDRGIAESTKAGYDYKAMSKEEFNEIAQARANKNEYEDKVIGGILGLGLPGGGLAFNIGQRIDDYNFETEQARRANEFKENTVSMPDEDMNINPAENNNNDVDLNQGNAGAWGGTGEKE